MIVYLIISGLVLCMYVTIILFFALGIPNSPNVIDEHFKPFISVLVSLKNESQNIVSLMESLTALNYPSHCLEIILVDDNSTDDTLQILKTYEDQRIIVVPNNGVGKKQAIETGVKIANGDWIAVTDADCTMKPNWLKSLVPHISDEVKMILGPVFISSSHGLLHSIQSIEFYGLQGATMGSANRNTPISSNAANMMFCKDAFDATSPYANNYDLKTGDDQFLLMAITNRFPKSVVYANNQDAIVRTNPVNKWNSYFNQRIRWASKGSAYSQAFPKIVGINLFFTSLIITTSMIIGLIQQDYYLAFGFLIVKLIVDLTLVIPMKTFSNGRLNWMFYLISGLFYPIVIMVSVIGGLGTGQIKH